MLIQLSRYADDGVQPSRFVLVFLTEESMNDTISFEMSV
jgi:hypothetical protein